MLHVMYYKWKDLFLVFTNMGKLQAIKYYMCHCGMGIGQLRTDL